MRARDNLMSRSLGSNGSSELAAPEWTELADKKPNDRPERLLVNLALLPDLQKREDHAPTAYGDVVDRLLHAAVAYFTAGLSPSALAEAYTDWVTHLTVSPGRQVQLIERSVRTCVRLSQYLGELALKGSGAEPCIEPVPPDRRFDGEAWKHWPFNLIYQGFLLLLQQQWWHSATTGVRVVTRQQENVVEFASRQLLDIMSPSNSRLESLAVLRRIFAEGEQRIRSSVVV